MDRLRDRCGVDDGVAAANEGVAGAGVGQVRLQVVLGLARILEAVPLGSREIGRTDLVASAHQPGDQGPADLSVRTGDENAHAWPTGR